MGLVAFFGLALGWSSWRAWQARADLTVAQTLASSVQSKVTSGDVEAAEQGLPGLKTRLSRAAGRTGGPAWHVAELVPVLGGNFSAIRRTAQAANLIGAQALPEAVAALEVVRRDKLLVKGRVDLVVLARMRVHLDRAAQVSARARGMVAFHEHALLPPVRRNVLAGQDKVNGLDGALQSAQKAVALAPDMLGEQGPRTYFVAVQNNAEARATGGLVGAFALVTADHGRITLKHTGTDTEFRTAAEPVPSDPAASVTWTRAYSLRSWFHLNNTPHFPDAARNLAGLWKAQGRGRLDGVIALDPLVMSELLVATGPVRLPDGYEITAANVIDFVGHDEYLRYPDPAARKRLLGDLAADVFHAVIAAKQPVATLQALARAGSSGHLYVWSRAPEDADRLGTGLVSGALPVQNTPYLSVLTQSAGGDKLDYYVRRTVKVTTAANGALNLTVTLRNTAPPGLPLYITVRGDRPDPPVPYGQALDSVSVYGPLVTKVRNIRVDGVPKGALFARDHGHQTITLFVELPRNQDVVVTAELTQPKGTLVYRQQPLVRPDTLEIEVPHTVLGR